MATSQLETAVRTTPARFPVDGDTFRRNNFDFLRLFLAVLVILAHSYYIALGTEETEPLMRASAGQVDMGDVAVNFFFVISGFLVSQSWLNSHGIRDFLRKRVLRIYPGFLVAMLFCAAVVVPLASDGASDFWTFRRLRNFVFQAVTLNPFNAPGQFANNPVPFRVNGSMWTIRYEVWCYVILAAAGAAGLLARVKWVVSAFVACHVLYVAHSISPLLPHSGPAEFFVGDFDNWPRFATFFLAGAAFYLLRARIPRSPLLAVLAAVGIACSMPFKGGHAVTLPVLGTYLAFFAAYAGGGRLHGFGRWGDFSYGVYLYAYPIQQLVVLWAGTTRLHPLVLFALATPLSLAAGAASWHFVEKHFLRLKRKHAARAAQPARARPSPADALAPAGSLTPGALPSVPA